MSGGVVPIDRESEVTGASPVFGEGILGSKRGEEMISISLSEESNTKAVNGKSESGATIDVA